MPKLSIITINLNNREGLQKTIDSVIAQTYKDFEWIVIDGGSTDGSKELIEQYAAHITYWVSEPDNGIYNAMNKGIWVARGEYLQFLNSGDWLINSNVLQNIFLHDIQDDVLYGNAIVLDTPARRKNEILPDNIHVVDLLMENILHQSMFIKKALFEQYGYYDETLKILSDWKFNLLTIGINQCTTHHFKMDVVLFETGGESSSTCRRETETKIVLNELFPKGVLLDYQFYLKQNEIRKYFISRICFSLLYRATIFYKSIIGKFKIKASGYVHLSR